MWAIEGDAKRMRAVLGERTMTDHRDTEKERRLLLAAIDLLQEVEDRLGSCMSCEEVWAIEEAAERMRAVLDERTR